MKLQLTSDIDEVGRLGGLDYLRNVFQPPRIFEPAHSDATEKMLGQKFHWFHTSHDSDENLFCKNRAGVVPLA